MRNKTNVAIWTSPVFMTRRVGRMNNEHAWSTSVKFREGRLVVFHAHLQWCQLISRSSRLETSVIGRAEGNVARADQSIAERSGAQCRQEESSLVFHHPMTITSENYADIPRNSSLAASRGEPRSLSVVIHQPRSISEPLNMTTVWIEIHNKS